MNHATDQTTQDLKLQRKIRGLTDENDPEKRKAADELVQTLGGSKEVLFKATTVFPFTLFPDTISVDRSKVTITHRNFLWSGQVLSIAIEDILNITASVGPFFGKIIITTRFFDPNRPYAVDHFWREDAMKLKRIIQGYLIARKKKVDLSALSDKELAKSLDELGKVGPEEEVNLA